MTLVGALLRMLWVAVGIFAFTYLIYALLAPAISISFCILSFLVFCSYSFFVLLGTHLWQSRKNGGKGDLLLLLFGFLRLLIVAIFLLIYIKTAQPEGKLFLVVLMFHYFAFTVSEIYLMLKHCRYLDDRRKEGSS